MATVYLIHFETPYLRGDGKELRHYLGATCLPLAERVKRHREGRGAALLRAATKAGIVWQVVRTWKAKGRKEAFYLEIDLKRRRKHSKMCPICQQEAGHDHKEGRRAAGSKDAGRRNGRIARLAVRTATGHEPSREPGHLAEGNETGDSGVAASLC